MQSNLMRSLLMTWQDVVARYIRAAAAERTFASGLKAAIGKLDACLQL